MSQVWSEINKVVNVLDLVEHVATTGLATETDIVNLENYKKLTFLITLGSPGDANFPTVKAYAGETATGATNEIAFKYRTQISGSAGSTGTTVAAGSDVSSALTDTTGDGFVMSTGIGGMYIIEVDPSTVAAADTTDQTYDHVKLTFTNDSSSASAAIYHAVAVLSEPRYPQAVLVTAID